jgi:hypothetical protein
LFGDIRQAETTDATCSKVEVCVSVRRHNAKPFVAPNNCNIADVLFISQIYNVKPELKHNKEQMLRQYSSSPNNAKPNELPSVSLEQ